ncbi:MAG: imidazolonepropionase, partial [Actinomycetota bacterium]
MAVESRSASMPALLIRDLEQVVTPAGGPAPLRGRALGELRVLERGYVLCEGGRVSHVGAMAELARADVPADTAELEGRGRSAVPGLVDCHTHACFAGDRAEEFALRAGGASYEELHAAGGGILATVRATRAAGEEGLARALERHRRWMLAHGTTT